MTDQLAVILAGRLVAHVERQPRGILRLEYVSGLAYGDTPLSLSLPVAQKVQIGQVVERYLDGLLPTSHDARESISREHAVDPNDVLSLLAAVGKDCAGAVQLCKPAEVADTIARAGWLEPCSEGDIESRLALMGMDRAASWVMEEEHWSLGGGHQKFALRFEDGQWHEARGSWPTSHIFKPGIYKLRSQALVEHLSMRAAALCGLDVAETEYGSFKSERSLVVRRYDRDRSASGDLVRLHQEDVCQAFGSYRKFADTKWVPEFEQAGGPSVVDIVDFLRDNIIDINDQRANVSRFMDGVIYNLAIAAPDAHARNYSLMLEGETVQLAPLYDVATGLAYDAPDMSLAMSIDGEYRAEAVTRDHLLRMAEAARIDGDRVLSRLECFAGLVPDAFRQAMADVDDWGRELKPLSQRLLPRLDAHSSRMTKISKGAITT